MSRLTSHSCLPPPTAPPWSRPNSGGTSSVSQWPAWSPTRRGPGGSYSGAGASGVRKERKKSCERAEPGAAADRAEPCRRTSGATPGCADAACAPSDGAGADAWAATGVGFWAAAAVCGWRGAEHHWSARARRSGQSQASAPRPRWPSAQGSAPRPGRRPLAALGAWRVRRCTRPRAPAAARRQIAMSVPSRVRLSRIRAYAQHVCCGRHSVCVYV